MKKRYFAVGLKLPDDVFDSEIEYEIKTALEGYWAATKKQTETRYYLEEDGISVRPIQHRKKRKVAK